MALTTTATLTGALADAPGSPAKASPPRVAMTIATQDRDSNGRLDTLRILSKRAMVKPTIGVLGYRVRGRRSVGPRKLIVRLAERGRPDTGARPRVRVGRGYARSAVTKVRDTAPPVMVSAAVGAPSDGQRRVEVVFSEPVYFAGAASDGPLSAGGETVTAIPRLRGATVLPGKISAGATPGSSTTVTLRPGQLPTDRAGNPAVVGSVDASVAQPPPPAPPPPAPDPAPEPAPPPTEDSSTWNTLSNPIDPFQQTAVAFGQRSHWLQPWRGYLDTVPATTLRDSIGINFNVGATEAPYVARLLAESGFRRARLEIGWSEVSTEDPTMLRNPAAIRAKIAALRDHGLRPLVLLNANHGEPGPTVRFDARITAPAAAGARQVQLDEASAARFVAGLSGFTVDGRAASYLVTAISPSGLATLSKPLPTAIEPGVLSAATLRYAPFTRPLTLAGMPHPEFERTLQGWLSYAATVTREVRSVLGSDDFDVEIWNEETFGADFLDAANYHSPLPAALDGKGDTKRAILERTISYLRDPANGVAGIGIGDGFANQSPWPAGSTSPRGLTAIDKHPYHAGIKRFPTDAHFNDNRPLDALGRADGTQDLSGRWVDAFTPQYTSFFPEYYLSAIQTEHLVRDISPITTPVGDVLHGRNTAPAGGSSPQLWVTETNIDPAGAGLTAAGKRRVQAKATLRTITSFVNKGVSAIHFYAVNDNDFALVDPTFYDAAVTAGGYPGADAGGETMRAVRRLSAPLTAARTPTAQRQLALREVADDHDHVQFTGDGTAAHPSLFNRDVVAFLPFQLDDDSFVVPAYVMTRNMARELAPERYRLKVGGLDTASLSATATDPLNGESVPVRIVSRSGDTAVLELELTDSPRLIRLDD